MAPCKSSEIKNNKKEMGGCIHVNNYNSPLSIPSVWPQEHTYHESISLIALIVQELKPSAFNADSPLTYAVHPWSVYCKCALMQKQSPLSEFIYIHFWNYNLHWWQWDLHSSFPHMLFYGPKIQQKCEILTALHIIRRYLVLLRCSFPVIHKVDNVTKF